MRIRYILKLMLDDIFQKKIMIILLLAMSSISIYMTDVIATRYFSNQYRINSMSSMFAVNPDKVNYVKYLNLMSPEYTPQIGDELIQYIRNYQGVVACGRFNNNKMILNGELVKTLVIEKDIANMGNLLLDSDNLQSIKNGSENVVYVGYSYRNEYKTGIQFNYYEENEKSSCEIAGYLKKGASWPLKGKLFGGVSDIDSYNLDNTIVVITPNYEYFDNIGGMPDTPYYIVDDEAVADKLKMDIVEWAAERNLGVSVINEAEEIANEKELRNITITIDYNNVICFLQRTEIVFMNNIFAERLKKAMEQKNMKQIDLVKKAAEQGVKLGKSHVSQYLSGKTTPRSEILNFLATTLGVETEWLKGTDVSVDTLKKETNEAGIQMENMKFDYNYNNMKENTRETVEEVQVREFKKSSKLNNVLYDVRGPVVEEAARMENAGTQVLKLNIGNPAPFGFRTPDEVIYDMRQQLTECEGYSPAKGLFSARKAIMQYAQLKKLPNVSIEDIYTGNGVSELINLCMSALLDNGDEILIPSPDYPLWTACATLAGGKAVHYICDEQAEWYPDMDDIRKKITSRTKAIVIINPNNPTGALYPREVLQQIVDIAREHHLIIFSDEIYDRLVMDGAEHISIASMAPDLFCVTFSGLSKSHMIAGFRIGWMILSGNKAVAKDYIEGIKMLSNMRLCSNVPAQSIVQTALGGHQSVESYIVPGGRIYEQREYIYNALTDIPGITAVKPKAAFYMFPKIDTKKFNIVNDEKFALDLLQDKKILIVQQQVIANAVRKEIEKRTGEKEAITTATWFMRKEEILTDLNVDAADDISLKEEDDFISLVEKEGYDVIFADPCMERMIPGFEGTFIPLTHFAVSGKLNV